ncbi:MAG: glycosyltransferase family 39 protein [Acidimicrobiia bacterium]
MTDVAPADRVSEPSARPIGTDAAQQAGNRHPASEVQRARVVRRLLLVALLAFAGRALYVVTVLQHEQFPDTAQHHIGLARSFDELYYVGGAEALARGDGFRFPLLAPVAEQAPHPPLTSVALAPVAALTDHELPMRLLVAAVGALVVLLAGLVALAVAGPGPAYVAAGVAALYPNLWMNDGLLMSETFAAAGTAGALFCSYRWIATRQWGWAGAAGGACALAALSRAELALLVPVMVLPLILTARSVPRWQRVRQAAVASAAAVVVVSPWVIYNLNRFEEPVLLSHADGDVLVGANCDATYSGSWLGFHHGSCGELVDSDDLPLDRSVRAAHKREAALRYIGDNLDRVPVVVTARVGRMWGVYGQGQMARIAQAEGRPVAASIAGLGMFWALVPVAIVGFRSLWRRGVNTLPLLAPFAVVTLNAALFFGLTRHRIGAEVPLVVLAAVGLTRLGDALRRRRTEGAPRAPQVA